MSEIAGLEPRLVWEQFDAITQVPRPSKKEGRIIDFLVAFAKQHQLEYKKDGVGNVVIRKPATPGFEERPAVILQSHMDMVCEKNSDVEFDFDNDPIRAYIADGWVRAEGTTLGADCGIGMAAALAVLIDPQAQHGPLEALFTVDEETGLTGAFELGEGMLQGKYLLNLDSEDEGELFIGCAGGIDTIATFTCSMEEAPKNYSFFRVDVSDLLGGHSGDDIDKGRVNSNKTVARLLWGGMQSCELRLSYFSGGNLRNAIPREVNIAFMNELAKIFNAMGIDTNDVIEAAASKWNFIKLKPGLVGGHCISVDPYYLIQKAQVYGVLPRIMSSARRLNDGMGAYVANQTIKFMNKKGVMVKDARILILGVTFKENCPDIRNTKIVDIYHTLQEYTPNITVFDPWANPEHVKHEYGIDIVTSGIEGLHGRFDAVIHAVAHTDFQQLDPRGFLSDPRTGVVYDVKGTLNPAAIDGRL